MELKQRLEPTEWAEISDRRPRDSFKADNWGGKKHLPKQDWS